MTSPTSTSLRRILIVLAATLATLLATAGASGAAPEPGRKPTGFTTQVRHAGLTTSPTVPAPNVVCGYNDNINGRAGWQNCDATNDYIRTTTFIGSESYQCVPGYQWHDLGPTWFIANSQLIGFC
jgi:hypothetical protein